MRFFKYFLGVLIAVLVVSSCSDDVPDHNGYGTDGGTSGMYFAVVGYYNDGKKEYKDLAGC